MKLFRAAVLIVGLMTAAVALASPKAVEAASLDFHEVGWLAISSTLARMFDADAPGLEADPPYCQVSILVPATPVEELKALLLEYYGLKLMTLEDGTTRLELPVDRSRLCRDLVVK